MCFCYGKKDKLKDVCACGNSCKRFCSSCDDNDSEEDLNPNLSNSIDFAIDLTSYYELINPTLEVIKARAVVVELFVLSAFLNTLSFLFIVAFYANNYDSRDSAYSILSYCPFLLKEVVLFFYILSKGSKINTYHDVFMSKLSKKILSYSRGPSNLSQDIESNNSTDDASPNLEYIQILTTIYVHSLQNPIEFKFFGYRVTRANLNLILFGFFSTAIPLMLKVYNSTTFNDAILT